MQQSTHTLRNISIGIRQMLRQHLPFALCTCVSTLLLVACSASRKAEEHAVHITDNNVAHSAATTLSYDKQRRFDELFLEAIRQKEAEHIDAEYELLDAALSINPNATEALYEMGVLKLSFSTYSDTLSRAQGDSLLRKAVNIEPRNVYYKETLATYLANSAKYREAIELYEEIAEQHESNETLSTLIWLYKTSGD